MCQVSLAWLMVGVLCVECTIKLCIPVPLAALLQGGSKRRVFDLFEDLKDGLILMDLMKILTGEEMVGEGTSHMSLHYNAIVQIWHALSLNCDNTTTIIRAITQPCTAILLFHKQNQDLVVVYLIVLCWQLLWSTCIILSQCSQVWGTRVYSISGVV